MRPGLRAPARSGAGLRAGAALLVAGTLLGGCVGTDTAETGDRDQAPFEETVVITKDGYRPTHARVSTGGSVTWINRDPSGPHTAETKPGDYEDMPGGEDASFDTHALSWEEPYTVTFHKPGTYRYGSSYDFAWEGTVTVIDRVPPSD